MQCMVHALHIIIADIGKGKGIEEIEAFSHRFSHTLYGIIIVLLYTKIT